MAAPNSIEKLLQAEEDAAKIVKAARDARNKRLNAADAAADREIAAKRDEYEDKFQKEINAKSDITDEFTRNLKQKTEDELLAMRQLYAQHQREIIQLMQHHVASVDLSIAPAMKQALIKYVSK